MNIGNVDKSGWCLLYAFLEKIARTKLASAPETFTAISGALLIENRCYFFADKKPLDEMSFI